MVVNSETANDQGSVKYIVESSCSTNRYLDIRV